MPDTTATIAGRRLPTDWGSLKPFLPPEPDNTTVTRTRLAIAAVDALVSSERGRLNKVDELDRQIVDELCAAALAGDELTGLAGSVNSDDRQAIGRRIELLDAARATLAHRLAVSERDDPDYVQWKERCARVTDEWRIAMDGDGDTDESRRFARLVQFAEQH